MSRVSCFLVPVLILCVQSMFVPTPSGHRRFHYTAPPLVIVRRDRGFVYDAKEDWWAYLTGILGIGAGLTILVYVLYTYNVTKLWRKEDPLLQDYPRHAAYAKSGK